MGRSGVPAKAEGLYIERFADELTVYNPTDESWHSLPEIPAAVFEACNGVRSSAERVAAVADWTEAPVEIDLVDRTILDLTEARLIVLD